MFEPEPDDEQQARLAALNEAYAHVLLRAARTAGLTGDQTISGMITAIKHLGAVADVVRRRDMAMSAYKLADHLAWPYADQDKPQ